jgi:hypothetical protein
MGISFFALPSQQDPVQGRFKPTHRPISLSTKVPACVRRFETPTPLSDERAQSKKDIPMLTGFCQAHPFGVMRWTGALPFQRAKVLRKIKDKRLPGGPLRKVFVPLNSRFQGVLNSLRAYFQIRPFSLNLDFALVGSGGNGYLMESLHRGTLQTFSAMR